MTAIIKDGLLKSFPSVVLRNRFTVRNFVRLQDGISTSQPCRKMRFQGLLGLIA